MSPIGPVREVRFKFNPDGSRDGGVHNTATITGRAGASGCSLALDDIAGQFARRQRDLQNSDAPLRRGSDRADSGQRDLANAAANASAKNSLGIKGHPNVIVTGKITGEANNNGNDGTIARFGWKAQNQSLLLFSGEAYNVEMGISNELFQQEREQKPACQFATVPNDVTDTEATTTPAGLSAIEKFAFFQRFLAPPTPSPDTAGWDDIDQQRPQFVHERRLRPLSHADADDGNSTVAALREQGRQPLLRPDRPQHGTGPGGRRPPGQARGDEFRTAPLWGLGQRIFFLHDGRTDDLLEAIRAHRSFGNLKVRSLRGEWGHRQFQRTPGA